MNPIRVAVTGIGLITPLGLDVPATWNALLAGESGVDRITAFDTDGFETQIAAEVKGFDPTAYMDAKEARRADRFSQFAVAASREALSCAGAGDSGRHGGAGGGAGGERRGGNRDTVAAV